MTYSITKVGKTYVLTYPNNEQTPLTYVTSVAFFHGKLISTENGLWKLKEDAPFLKSLITAAEKTPNNETFKALEAMESFYLEFIGTIPVEATEQQKTEIKAARSACRTDLFNNAFEKDSVFTSSDGEEVDLIDALKLGNSSITIGDMVEQRKKANGAARNAYRKTKKT